MTRATLYNGRKHTIFNSRSDSEALSHVIAFQGFIVLHDIAHFERSIVHSLILSLISVNDDCI